MCGDTSRKSDGGRLAVLFPLDPDDLSSLSYKLYLYNQSGPLELTRAVLSTSDSESMNDLSRLEALELLIE